MDIGDCVRILRVSKGGKEYYEHGVILDVDNSLEDMFNKHVRSGETRDSIRYIILTEDNEEIVEYGRDVEADIQTERELKLNRIFRDKDE